MISALRKWFSKPVGSQTVSPNEIGISTQTRLRVVPPIEREPLTDERLQQAIDLFKSGIHDIHSYAGFTWGKVKPVQCPTKFGGWGFVEGRSMGMKINDKLVIVEADEDMDFTELCVVLNDVPVLILYKGRNGLTVFIINGQDYIEEVFNPTSVKWETVEQFRKLPQAVQKILEDVVRRGLEISEAKPCGVEEMLRY